jgi:hypothetical protein
VVRGAHPGQQIVTEGVVTTDPVGLPPPAEHVGVPEGLVVACAERALDLTTHWPTVVRVPTELPHESSP